ncbi:hypothetical protein BCM02_112138 [Paenibacillus methanolicus]|uniref:Uncharacterized protein n=1 Tax=Paenibacillus methanolicus TaxID=582686 RepID=A0A5S5BSX0_9BACL|nr:hypothetical protein BCM02_112138 [Paenibacillus methanolicus]
MPSGLPSSYSYHCSRWAGWLERGSLLSCRTMLQWVLKAIISISLSTMGHGWLHQPFFLNLTALPSAEGNQKVSMCFRSRFSPKNVHLWTLLLSVTRYAAVLDVSFRDEPASPSDWLLFELRSLRDALGWYPAWDMRLMGLRADLRFHPLSRTRFTFPQVFSKQKKERHASRSFP